MLNSRLVLSLSWHRSFNLVTRTRSNSLRTTSGRAQANHITHSSWTDTTGTSRSARVTCPPGGIKCGLTATPSICKITGSLGKEYDKSAVNVQQCPKLSAPTTYTVESVCMKGVSGNKDMNAVTDVSSTQRLVLFCFRYDFCLVRPRNGFQSFHYMPKRKTLHC